jgi:uncharacterized protein (UPF0276 family)
MPLVGIGLKAKYYRDILEAKPDIGFFEVHAENYMGAGGPPHRYLTAIAELYPISMHGVGLSIGGDHALDTRHLCRLRELLDRYEPALFSEHLAWSTHSAIFFDDLLPLPYTKKTLRRVADHVDAVQTALGRTILVENPSTYLAFSNSTYSEVEFIAEIAKRTGCGLLLDVNNVFVSSTNQRWDPMRYIDAFPLREVREIHLAGYTREVDEKGQALLIDTHNAPVSAPVWNLFEYAVMHTGPVPTLIEWDDALPTLGELQAEAQRAASIIETASYERSYAAR